MILHLPYPPSVNHYYATFRGRRIVSAAGREFRAEVQAIIGTMKLKLPNLSGRLCVEVMLYPADRRETDLDNRLKSLLDALGKAGVYADDSQIDRLTIERGEVREGGEVCVQITERGEA